MSLLSSSDLTCDVVLEQALGHVTHGRNLSELLPRIDGFVPTFLQVEFDVHGKYAWIPGYDNWTLRAGVRARRAIRRSHHARSGPPDAMFVHTQVPAVLLGKEMKRVPTVVSLDATPMQYDRLGPYYSHEVGHPAAERLKWLVNRRCFERSRQLVTWATWTKRSLIDDYGIEPDKITVIPPGVHTERWLRRSTTVNPDGVVRILFVGGDLGRKGGDLLLKAFGTVRRRHGRDVELHMVTPTPVDPRDGVVVHPNLTPNSSELIALYHQCDIFCLPTLGDCLPMVLPEAAAAGLALVASDVGAIAEIVREGETGCLVAPGDVEEVANALELLIVDPQERSRLAKSATELVVAEHDAARNAARVVQVIRRAVA